MADIPIWTTAALLDDLNAYISARLTGLYARLYTNNHTPTPTDVSGDYTQAVWSAYLAQGPTAWTAASLDGNIAVTDSGDLTFPVGTGDGGVTVYGVYLTDAGNTVVYHALKFDTPIVTVDNVDIVLNIRVRELNP